MNAVNPYAPPTAHVTDVDEDDGQTQPLRVSTYKGRIGRLRYLAWMFAAYLVVIGLGALAGALSALTRSPELVSAVIGILSLLFLIPWAFWTIQRSHDMGWSGWTWLFTIIPLAVLIWIFKGGTKGRNRFGAPPPPNTIGVHLLAWVVPVIFVAIMAAVAIPAYQSYVKRANAAQAR